MDDEIKQLLMEMAQILAEMKVTTQRLEEKCHELKKYEINNESDDEQEKKMEESIAEECPELRNSGGNKESKDPHPEYAIGEQEVGSVELTRPNLCSADPVVIHGVEMTQPNLYISDQAILPTPSNFSFPLSSFTSSQPPFSLLQFHFCSRSYSFVDLQPLYYGAQIPTLLFNNSLNITSSSSFECSSLTQSNNSYIEPSAALTSRGYSLRTAVLDLPLSQFEDDERVLAVFALVDSAMGGKSGNNSEWRLIWENGKNAYKVFNEMTQRAS